MLTNNDVLKKLRVAHKLRDEGIIEILKLVDFEITKGALGDLFRDPKHPKFVIAGDQILRNFLDGLIIHMRGERPRKEDKKNNLTFVDKKDSSRGNVTETKTEKSPVKKRYEVKKRTRL